MMSDEELRIEAAELARKDSAEEDELAAKIAEISAGLEGAVTVVRWDPVHDIAAALELSKAIPADRIDAFSEFYAELIEIPTECPTAWWFFASLSPRAITRAFILAMTAEEATAK